MYLSEIKTEKERNRSGATDLGKTMNKRVKATV